MSAALPQDVSAQYDNLGLDTARAKNWQRWLKDLGQNPGTIDGLAVDGKFGAKTKDAFWKFNA